MKKNLAVLLMIGILGFSGCGKADTSDEVQAERTEKIEETENTEETESIEEENIEAKESTEEMEVIYSVKESTDLTMLDGMEQKSHDFVSCQNKVYYREYNENSFAAGRTDEDDCYETEPDVESKMMCMEEDGTIREVFGDKGSGDIYIQDGRFYMTELLEKEDSEGANVRSYVYSVDMNGSNRRDYGEGTILGADDENHVLLYKKTDYDTCYENKAYAYGNEICKINTLTGETERILGEHTYVNFLLLEDGVVYYGVPLDTEEENRYMERLSSLSLLDGSCKTLAEISGEGITSRHLYEVKISGDKAYFSYGGYEGSGGCWQAGTMGTAMLDGSGYQIFSEKDYSFDDGVIFDREFYILDAEEDYMVFRFGSMALNMQNGEVVGTYFPEEIVEGSGIPFYWEEKNSVGVFPDDSGTFVEIVSSFRDKIPDGLLNNADAAYDYENMAYVNGDLYFTVVGSVYDDEYSAGWRCGVRRVSTLVFRLAAGEEKAQLIYQY